MVNKDKDFVEWNSKLECGIKLIDEQHRKLVKLVNEMYNHATGNEVQERDYFNSIIQQTVEYVKNHFATEEKIMIITKFEGYYNHKKEHDHFILTIVKKIRDYNEGNRLTLSSFSRFLKDWILSHIVFVDKQYIEHLKKSPVIKIMKCQ